jgi:hypothetical protein
MRREEGERANFDTFTRCSVGGRREIIKGRMGSKPRAAIAD